MLGNFVSISLGEVWSVSPSGSTTTESWPIFWPPIPGGHCSTVSPRCRLTGQAANLTSMSASGPRVQQHLALLQGALDAVAGGPPKEAGCTGRIDHPLICWSPNWHCTLGVVVIFSAAFEDVSTDGWPSEAAMMMRLNRSVQDIAVDGGAIFALRGIQVSKNILNVSMQRMVFRSQSHHFNSHP